MDSEALILRESIVRAKAEIIRVKAAAARLEQQLKDLVDRCNHNWSEVEFCPEYESAYTIPGDKPGTMGVDFRGPTHVPAKTIKKWMRECSKCGQIQTTHQKMPSGKEVPDFG